MWKLTVIDDSIRSAFTALADKGLTLGNGETVPVKYETKARERFDAGNVHTITFEVPQELGEAVAGLKRVVALPTYYKHVFRKTGQELVAESVMVKKTEPADMDVSLTRPKPLPFNNPDDMQKTLVGYVKEYGSRFGVAKPDAGQ